MSEAAPVAVYDVALSEDGGTLTASARFSRVPSGELTALGSAVPFFKDVALKGKDGWQKLAARDDESFAVPACKAAPCELRWSFRLAEAATTLDDRGTAELGGAGVSLAVPGAFLLQPTRHVEGVARFTLKSGVCGAFLVKGAYQVDAAVLHELPSCVFGKYGAGRLAPTPESVIDVAYLPGAPDAKIVGPWIERAAKAVVAYYGRYPVAHVLVVVGQNQRGKGAGGGWTYGGGGAIIRINVGDGGAEALADDWVLTHEMVHLAFPSVPRRHHWIEEGIATYVEPFARVRSGELRAERVWGDLLRDLPKGLPDAGDEGLDHTATWGRTYWGGALFCFVADVEIREKTQNAKGLVDALRAILAETDMSQDRELAATLAIGDKAIGVPVLVPLYDAWKAKAHTPDLAALWKKLGIEKRGDALVLDPKAPLAKHRDAIAGK